MARQKAWPSRGTRRGCHGLAAGPPAMLQPVRIRPERGVGDRNSGFTVQPPPPACRCPCGPRLPAVRLSFAAHLPSGTWPTRPESAKRRCRPQRGRADGILKQAIQDRSGLGGRCWVAAGPPTSRGRGWIRDEPVRGYRQAWVFRWQSGRAKLLLSRSTLNASLRSRAIVPRRTSDAWSGSIG